MRDDYVLGHSSDEYERLRRQAEVLEPATRRVFQSIGLRPGWTCLDVGCGPGEGMRLMGEFVGPSGEVTGLDRDCKAGCEAIGRRRAAGTSRYHFIEADIETVDQIGGTLFDLTFARLALLFVRDPLQRIARCTAGPGQVDTSSFRTTTFARSTFTPGSKHARSSCG